MAEQNNFEKGELITPASLELQNFQKAHTQISGAPTTGDILRVSGTTAGPPNKQPANMTNQERAIARINGAMMNAYKPDTNRFNKITTYNATHHGRNFERYYANTAGFKKLGFSPFRDNEALYNKNTSLWDDAQRGIVAAAKLYGGAFAGSAKNWSNPFSMDPNTEEADEMARLMSIGSSSRGGFGGTAINFGVNTAYGMGVLGEVLAEEAALAGIAALTGLETGGATVAVAGARTVMNAKRLMNAFSLGRAAKSFANTFRAATKITEARQLWGVAKGLAKTADHLLPFSQTRSLLTASGKTAAKWNSLDNMAKTTKAFGSFYRDLREINAVTYESKLEGGGVQNEVITEMMSEFRKKNGRDPNDQEAKAMYGEGHKAGYLASQLNAVGIYISNKIVLNKALKGLPGISQADDVARRTMKGTLLKVKDWAKKGVNPWEVASGIKKYGKAAFYKQTFNPKNLAKGGLGYLSANLMEGTQEVYQEAIANGVTSYYMSAFNNPSRVGGAEFQAKMLSGLKSQMSGQGMETFLSGFLMAGPMTASQSAFYGAFDMGRRAKLKIQDKKFKADPANAGKASPFEQQLNAEKDYDNKVVDALNDITKDPKKYFSAIEQNARTQVDLERLGEQAAADGDTHAAKNIKDESLTNHIITLLESGHFEIFQEQLKGLKDLETSELQEAFDEPGDAKKTVSQRIDTVLKRTEQIKATYQKYQEKTNPFSMRQDPLSYMAFEQARNIAIRNDVTYQRAGERMSDILTQFNSEMPFTNANAADFTNLFVVGGQTEGGFDRIGLDSEIQLLDGQIQNLSDSIPEQKAQKDQLIQKRDNLKSLSGTIQAYASAYKVTQSAAQTAEKHATNMDTFIETEKIFKKAYTEYVQTLAKGSGQTVLNSSIDSSFDKLSDFWKLHADQQDVANAVNMMQNPDMYRIATERLRESMSIAFERRQESLKEALADYKKKHLVNAFLNDLFEKYNAFVEPEEAEAYINKDTVPETFYDSDTLEEIEPGSAKYRGIMALIDQYDEIYFEETGERLIRTDELKNAERTAGYDVTTNKSVAQEFRPRDAEDKRSIKAIADEFGFNHIDDESSTDAVEVLKAIARSKHGYVPRAQKKLAQALLGFIKPGTQIRFKNGHRTNSTYDATNGIIVDANFSAEGFENANIPIEFSILNAVMQQVASESLSDTAFNDRITSVREQFEEALSDLDKKYFKYALTNNQQFIAEAMTNADLQAEMGKIGYEGELTEQTAEAKTVWESFMDSIYELLEKIFGVTRGKTLYQEAMNVITNKLSQPGVAGPSSVPSVLAENETEEEIDIEEDDPELEQKLRAKFNEVVATMSPADKVGINFESWKQSDSMAVTIRNKHSAEKIKKTTAAPSSPTVMTEAEQVRRLTSLGYQISEINNMKKGGQQDEIDNIIKNDIKKKIQVRTTDSNGNTTFIEVDYDQPIAARPNVITAINKAIQTLEDANIGLNADGTGYMERVQVGVDPDTGEPIYKKKEGTPDYAPISSVVKDKFEGTSKESEDRNNIIDLLLKDFLKGNILDIRQFNNAYNKYQRKHNSAAFSQEMLNDLFDKFRSVQILLKSNGFTIISNLPGLFGKIGNKQTAGTIDLIAYDAAGKIYIIDLKTSTQDRRAQYKLETDLETAFGSRYSEIKEAIKGGKDRNKTLSETIASTRISAEDKEKLKKVAENNPTADVIYFYKDQDAKQQNAKRELLRQSTGLVADVLTVFPLLTTKAGKIFTKVEFQKEGKDHSMAVESYDIHDKLGLVNEATYPENPINKTATASTTTAEPTTTTKPAEVTSTETQITDITRRKQENDVKYAEMQARQKKELEDLNKKEGKNYRDTFDILNVNEYSEDQSQRSQEAIDLANKHEKEFEQLLNEKRGIEDDAAKISYGGRDLFQKQALVAKLKDLLSKIYRADRNALEEGFMIAPNALAEAEKVGGVNYSAHGMAKTGLAGATEALIDLFTNGINPLKGRGALDTAPLAGGISVGTTAGGNAYMEGPFTLVANKSVQGAITSVDQIAGVVVNEGIATEEVLNTLRELFPDIVFESTSNTSKLVEQLNAKTTTTTTEQTTTTDPRVAAIERRRQEDLKQLTRTVLYGTNENGEIDLNTTLTIGKGEPIQLDDIENKNEIIISDGNYVGRARRNSKGLWDYKIGAGGMFDLNDQELFEQFQRQKIRNGNITSTFKYDAEPAALKEQPADIENDEYNNFIDNGVVTKERIQSIADKVKNNEQLTPREMEIFSDKTSEINTEIASQMPTEANPNQAEIDKLTQEYEDTVAKRKTYYNSLRQKVGKVSQDVYLNNLKASEDRELANLKETYEQALEALGVQRSPESQLENISKMNLPESVLNLRESIAKADRVQLSTIEANIKPLIELGIADVVLKQQNLTRDEVNDLIKNARARLKGTLAHSELANTMRLRKPLEERVVYYDTEKGTQAGVLVSFDNNAVFVAPYTGKEGMSDLQDKSKWVTFTVSEIPYKLFYAKTTAPVTATPDITQQSDDLVKDGEANKTAVDDFKNDISNDDFKDQSADDAANDLFDDLNNCIKPE